MQFNVQVTSKSYSLSYLRAQLFSGLCSGKNIFVMVLPYIFGAGLEQLICTGHFKCLQMCSLAEEKTFFLFVWILSFVFKFSPTWILSCLLKSSFYVDFLSHLEQAKGIPPVQILSCLLKSYFHVKVLPLLEEGR